MTKFKDSRSASLKTVLSIAKSKLAKKIFIFIALSLPIIVYASRLLLTGNKIAVGDGDYYIQLYEAARRTILDFHQLPLWNPWVAGGVPLFANPQFGPISIQSVTTLVFGSVFGYKLALVAYLLLGFFGIRKLVISTHKADSVMSALVAYVWTFSSFFVYRSVGHYTFFVIGFLPWMLYFFINKHTGKNLLWFALTSSALIWSSMHYTTILSFFILALYYARDFLSWVFDAIKKHDFSYSYFASRLQIKKVFYAGLVLILLTLPRIYATLEYSHDFPRLQSQIKEEPLGFKKTTYALFGPDQYKNPPEPLIWTWGEVSTYVGAFTALALALTLLCLILSQADFAKWSPFTLLRELPVFSSMRVATRWINWAAFFILLFIGSVRFGQRKQRIIILCALFLSASELFLSGFSRLHTPYNITLNTKTPQTTFTQLKNWNQQRGGVPYDENFTEATMNNIGQIIAGDSLIDTRQPDVPTARCDETKEGCLFVSSNAEITYWSPNELRLKRISGGPIEINMNPSSNWLVNGKQVFKAYRVVETNQLFIIQDQSTNIVLKYQPSLPL
jgi:hypothetical protein